MTTTEAEKLAVELTEDIEGFPEPTQLERKAAALLRKLAAEVEALRVDAGRKDALLREALSALKYHTHQTRPIERTFDVMDKIKEELK